VLKFVPVMVTVVPNVPELGEKEIIVGTGPQLTTKLFELLTDPPDVVTEILPVIALVGTVTVIEVAVLETTTAVTVVRSKPSGVSALNFTVLFAGVVLKFVPVMVTVVPTGPEVGVKDVMVGIAPVVTVKFVALVAVFPATVTVMVPVVAPAGTVVVMDVAVLAVTTDVVPLNLTVLLVSVELKFVPVMVTVVLTVPLVGVKLVMVGKVEPPTNESPVIVHERVISNEVLGTCPVVV
jgi:hypothetical protein